MAPPRGRNGGRGKKRAPGGAGTLAPKKHPAITPPSAESGGIPEPTAAYLANAALPPQPTAKPKPLLVVLDLNGTLVFRDDRSPWGHSRKMTPRPFAAQFLRYCITTFHVVVWSSAKVNNVHAMLQKLAPPDVRALLVAVWSRNECGLSPAEFNARTQVYKRLERVWNDPTIAYSHPSYSSGERWDQSNTVLVDDSIEKARSEPHNAVTLAEFTGTEYSPVLPLVHDYLNTLAGQTDVSRYIRANPFH